MLYRIAIVGPESTGKSVISEQLARHYNTLFVAEYARQCIEQLQREYTLQDIETIARAQFKNENELARQCNNILICDTNLLVTKIWAEHAFGTCPKFITQHWKANDYGLHLLMQIDLPWQYDAQREHPHKRNFFFNWYKQELKSAKANYTIIEGTEEQRLLNAIAAIDTFLSTKN